MCHLYFPYTHEPLSEPLGECVQDTKKIEVKGGMFHGIPLKSIA